MDRHAPSWRATLCRGRDCGWPFLRGRSANPGQIAPQRGSPQPPEARGARAGGPATCAAVGRIARATGIPFDITPPQPSRCTQTATPAPLTTATALDQSAPHTPPRLRALVILPARTQATHPVKNGGGVRLPHRNGTGKRTCCGLLQGAAGMKARVAGSGRAKRPRSQGAPVDPGQITYGIMRTNKESGSRIGRGCVGSVTTT
jgi:hypothetical protein